MGSFYSAIRFRKLSHLVKGSVIRTNTAPDSTGRTAGAATQPGPEERVWTWTHAFKEETEHTEHFSLIWPF